LSQGERFSVGQIVRLKSGGPDMTVKEELRDYTGGNNCSYRCQWFAGKKLEQGNFPHESLDLVDDE